MTFLTLRHELDLERAERRHLEEAVAALSAKADQLQAKNETKKSKHEILLSFVPFISLLVTAATAWIAIVRNSALDIQAARTELRPIIQRLSVIPGEGSAALGGSVSTPGTSAPDPLVAERLGAITAENILLARQAFEIMTVRIPADQVTTVERVVVARALVLGGSLFEARLLLDAATAREQLSLEHVGALRMYGQFHYFTGDLEAGRGKYEQALNVIAKIAGQSPTTPQAVAARANQEAATRLDWSMAASAQGLCEEAMSQVDRARESASIGGPQALRSYEAMAVPVHRALADCGGTSSPAAPGP